MKEIWKDIAGYEGAYQVSNLGRVRSLTRIVRNGTGFCPKNGRILRQNTNTKGYLLVGPTVNRVQRTRPVHRLVAEAFIPNPLNLPEVNHKREPKTNNRVTNLEWSSSEDNMAHAVRNGLRARGDELPMTKLKPVQIPLIRKMLRQGISMGRIARKFGVNHGAIRGIKTGRSWRYIK